MRHHKHHDKQKAIAVYPGSFDPITQGHLDIIERATFLFDEVHILVAHNPAKKTGMFAPVDRVDMIREATEFLGDHVSVSNMESLEATVDICTRLGARAMIRGLRTVTDFDAEFGLAIANMGLADHIETVFMVPQPESHFISSSRVREIFMLRGADSVRDLVPPVVWRKLKHAEKD